MSLLSLTLRKVSRDPFSINSVMIITGLPAGANKQSLSVLQMHSETRGGCSLWGDGDMGRRPQLWLASLSDSVPGGYMACRHQSQWQLLISPLHKRQEIIRMDQSSRISVCVCEGWGVLAGGGSSWDPMNTNQPQGKKRFVVGSLCTCICMTVCFQCMWWWRSAWLTGPMLQHPYKASAGAYKWMTNHKYWPRTHPPPHTHTPLMSSIVSRPVMKQCTLPIRASV